jgi:membrane protease YdiL (CAAX protease family)
LSLEQVGLARLLEWSDIGLGLAGVIVYILVSTVALTVASNIPGFSPDQAQDIGLGRLFGTDVLLGFFVLVVLTPVFEEAIFRGFLYGRLRNLQFPWWISSLIVSVLFGLAHMQWNVGVDVFCLSMVACILREMTGSIWAGVLLHMVKNFLAFLVTFVFIQSI